MGDGKVGPRDGAISPLGNGKGSTMAEGPDSGAHNFLEDPSSAAPTTGGRDFTKESREQKSGPADDIDKPSVPQGGPMPFGTGDSWARGESTADGGIAPATTPFKNLK